MSSSVSLANQIAAFHPAWRWQRRLRVAAQVDFLARKFRLDAAAVNAAVFQALEQLEAGSSAASAYAAAAQTVKQQLTVNRD